MVDDELDDELECEEDELLDELLLLDDGTATARPCEPPSEVMRLGNHANPPSSWIDTLGTVPVGVAGFLAWKVNTWYVAPAIV
jgi:hypothetical protein